MMNRTFNNARVLDNDTIRRYAPSVFAEQSSQDTSSKYLFVPTIDIVNQLSREGFNVVDASQSRAKSEDGKVYAKHMLRFRHESKMSQELLSLGDSVAELVLVNSHNGLSSFQFNLALFRQVCSNGLIASDSLASARVNHTGFDHTKVIDAVYSVIGQETKLIESVAKMREVNLAPEERLALAQSALTLRYDEDDTKPKAEQLLRPRRYADQGADLWTTFNVVQENMLRGGLRTISTNERGQTKRNSTRAVNSVSENKRLNQALWTLAESMRSLKAGA